MTTLFSSRSELRHTSRQTGRYFRSLTNEDRTAFEDGLVELLNKSEKGALLEVSRPFHAGDIIEVQWRQRGKQSTIKVPEGRRLRNAAYVYWTGHGPLARLICDALDDVVTPSSPATNFTSSTNDQTVRTNTYGKSNDSMETDDASLLVK